jgi:hypothetical protein
MLVPVEVISTVKGETKKRIINVSQQDDWGAIPMKKNAEYLLFLENSLMPEHGFYSSFYGQGIYNTDGKDPRTSSAGFYDFETVQAMYGDRVDFVEPDLPQAAQSHELISEKSWFNTWLTRLKEWLF